MKDQKFESRERLIHIWEAILQIEIFIQDISKDVFLNDQLVASAVLFQLSVIGEAIIHVDKDLLGSIDYPWHKVGAFRNLIFHMYFQIKLEAVWEIIKNDLPELMGSIETILKKEF